MTEGTYHPNDYGARDEARENWLAEHFPDCNQRIFTKLKGVSHLNRNGSCRQQILQACRVNELLQLVREPDNPADEHAIAVYRQNGEQLGYLSRELAQEMQQRFAKGEQWNVVLTEITGRDHDALGANIALVGKVDIKKKRAKPESGGKAASTSA